MVKLKGNLNWRTVQVDDAIFQGACAEGLIAIEECTDYDILKGSQSPKRKAETLSREPKKKKKKLSKTDVGTLLSPSKQGSTTNEKDETIVDSNTTLNNESSDDFLSWARFGLPSPILKAIHEQGFKEPTQIQSLTLPPAILGRRDIIGAAETGSGKTLAFGLPILTAIYNDKQALSESQENQKPLYALILTPTRELAVQIKNHLTKAAKYMDIHVAVVVGGMAAVKQERILGKRPEIVVATPGRLWELIQQGNPHLSQIDNLKFLVIDETDRMLEKGHFEELHDLLERLNQDKSKKQMRQNFVFSATLTLVHELPKYLTAKVKRFKNKKMNPEQKLKRIIDTLGITNPKIVDVTEGTGTSKTLTESRITCNITDKDYYIYYFLQQHPGRTIIFCNSIGCVRRLANLLSLLDCRPLPLHASMQQRQRLKNLERFRDDERGILVATDVAARGLDIPKVDHVIHYQTPRTSESYVHRSGRTARASLHGLTILLIEPTEIQNYMKLCRTLGKSEDLPVFPINSGYFNAVKERVNLARELDKMDLHIRKNNSEAAWFLKAAEDMELGFESDDSIHRDFNTEEMKPLKKAADFKRKQLAALLQKPIFPKGFSGKYGLSLGEAPSCFEEKEKAIEVMKNELEKSAQGKKKNIPLFKPRKTQNKISEKIKNVKNKRKAKM